MNTLTPLFNRQGQLPDDGWFHLVPRGEYPNVTDDGRQVMQVLDDAAFDAMLKNFTPKVLIDQEHFSHDTGKSSEAFGWISELQKRADGVWGRVEWTDLGETAIKNRRYRFISPTWNRLQKIEGDRLRPLHIRDAGLTNQPNLRGMVPLSNRAGETTPDGQHQQTKTQLSMKNIAAKLGLSADASEESIVAELVKLQNRAADAEKNLGTVTTERDTLKNRVTELDAEQIEQELDARGVEEGKRTRLTPVLTAMKNRDERVAFLDEVIGTPEEIGKPQTGDEPATASGKPALLRNRAGTPKPGKAGAPGQVSDQERATRIEAEVQDYKLRNRCTYEQAHSAVRLQKPELFGVASGRN